MLAKYSEWEMKASVFVLFVKNRGPEPKFSPESHPQIISVNVSLHFQHPNQ